MFDFKICSSCEKLTVAEYSIGTAGTCLGLRDSKGPVTRGARTTGWAVTLTAMTVEVLNRLMNANSIGESFLNVNIFRILI